MSITTKYELFHPDHELAVHYLLGMEKAVNNENFSTLFREAGILDKDPNDWVSAQIYVGILNTLAERGSEMMDFVAIGMRIAADVVHPPEFMALPFEKKFSDVTQILHLYMRGTDYGYWKYEQVSASHIVYRLRSPFPEDVWYGVIYGLTKIYLPAEMSFKVYYDKDQPRREHGGSETRYHIEWWEKDNK